MIEILLEKQKLAKIFADAPKRLVEVFAPTFQPTHFLVLEKVSAVSDWLKYTVAG